MARILLVDDDKDVREVLRQILEKAGHEIVEASDGRQAMAVFHQHRADIVITDILMPHKGGIDVIQELLSVYGHVCTIAVSGGSAHLEGETLLDLARKSGASHVLKKPVKSKELLAAIEKCLEASAP